MYVTLSSSSFDRLAHVLWAYCQTAYRNLNCSWELFIRYRYKDLMDIFKFWWCIIWSSFMICMMVPACQLCYHILPIQLPNYLITKEMVWNPLTAGTLAATTGTWTPASTWTPGWWWTKAWCRPPPWTWTPSWATRAQTWETRATTWAAWAQCSTNPPTVCGRGM